MDKNKIVPKCSVLVSDEMIDVYRELVLTPYKESGTHGYVGMWAKESMPCEEPQRISDDMLEFIRKCNAIKENPYG